MTGETRELAPAVIWHEVECGGYGADLELWDALAAGADGPVIDLGCGTGRVALRLASRGGRVTAVDRDPELLAELSRRAAAGGVEVATALADVRELRLGGRFALALAPMQLVQMLGGAGGRAAMLRSATDHLLPGGRLAAAILASDPPADGDGPAVPDVRERGGWIYSSLPVEVRRAEATLEVRRLRQAVSPEGELSEELDLTRIDILDVAELEAEGLRAGLRPVERVQVPATAEHVGSTVVVFERGEAG